MSWNHLRQWDDTCFTESQFPTNTKIPQLPKTDCWYNCWCELWGLQCNVVLNCIYKVFVRRKELQSVRCQSVKLNLKCPFLQSFPDSKASFHVAPSLKIEIFLFFTLKDSRLVISILLATPHFSPLIEFFLPYFVNIPLYYIPTVFLFLKDMQKFITVIRMNFIVQHFYRT